MPDIYHKYRSKAVERYLIQDDYTMKKNSIFYPIGDSDLVPKPLNYDDFDYGGTYHFLLQLLPREVWYIIFEMKYVIEKMEYVTFYFTPKYKNPVLLYKSNETEVGELKNFKGDTVWGRMYDDFTDVVSCISRTEARMEKVYNTIFYFKEFINRWYFLLKELRNNYYDDQRYHSEGCPADQLFYKGDYCGVYRFVKLYQTLNAKIYEFEASLFSMKDIPEERNKKVIAKILIYDVKKYAFSYLYEYFGIMDEPIEQSWRFDFFEYYYNFSSWVKICGIESQEDLAVFMDYYKEGHDYYYNPKWFEKDEDSDDFPLWVMIQEFC